MTPLLVLIAGPYRSGTQGDPTQMARNLQALEQAALAAYRRGHVPLIGEWLALPLARQAGSMAAGDSISEDFLYPASHRLLGRCDAVWRIEGASGGADEDVRQARARGIPVYFTLDALPVVTEQATESR